MERFARFQSLILHFSRFSHKSSPDKRNFALLSKALGKELPPMFPKKGPLWKQMSISTFPSQNSHRERHSICRALVHPSLQVPGKWAPFQVPQRGPYGERCPSPSMEPHADGRPTNNGVRHGSLRGSFTTPVSLP